jgi:hypothetical protein
MNYIGSTEEGLDILRCIGAHKKEIETLRTRVAELEAGLDRMCRCDEMPEGPYRCDACTLLKP